MSPILASLIEKQRYVAGLIFDRDTSLPGLITSQYLGVGIGYRRRGGQRTNELCLRIYVSAKLSPVLVPPAHLISGFIFGIPADVAQVGRFVAYGGGNPPPPSTATIPGSGIQISPPYQSTKGGTFGAVLLDNTGARYALSANHVIARNGLPTGPVQYSIIDTGDNSFVLGPNTPIGTDVRWANLSDGCQVDCAAVKAAPGVTLTQHFAPELGTPSLTPVAPDFGAQVAKSGHASQLTFGTVADHFADIDLDCGPGLGVVHITQAILIESGPEAGAATFGLPGDSGSLAFQQSNNQWSPLGLLMGGPRQNLGPANLGQTENYVALCPFSQVLPALSASIPGVALAPLDAA